MSSPTTGRTLQDCRNCGGGAPVDVHFCPQCSQILTIGRHGDYFAFLGVPRKLNLDAADLEQRFRVAEPAVSSRLLLQRDAGRASREPRAIVVSERRVSHAQESDCARRVPARSRRVLGESRGRRCRAAKVPAALLEEVFALNEELDEVRELAHQRRGARTCGARSSSARARRSRRSRRRTRPSSAELSARWDALGANRGADGREREAILAALRDCVLERNYINNLLEGIERELNAVRHRQWTSGSRLWAPGLTMPEVPKPEA